MSYEEQGRGYDPGASGHELQGRRPMPCDGCDGHECIEGGVYVCKYSGAVKEVSSCIGGSQSSCLDAWRWLPSQTNYTSVKCNALESVSHFWKRRVSGSAFVVMGVFRITLDPPAFVK